ncbi:MAG: 6-phosphofructokinase [Hydrogenophilales bacterium CG03_land_8_20_14_0_80_62_28]|nr:6-phosphofructokinase [Betaproteobacteria bacterium]OIO76876.1 MAG: 6-phosphofructokinase [Hydrogenophilaceae bacterium CG1_02_62_390]PIV22264.1 MAG: 6-phosphofructokinase [Hydrogenophilales bacterium CG03_land_8_20_14_0_80_62_28]PIW39745.1 MAG: 6-phosphofructokinase [Hydrogenophilales bacterium CG15_BIG_FIL_POST_REV_8_21_14_020_62_31]PIW72074.1 MAG: 6-phosphofructokinase [Hydrogenophilales bacterium CG12_big_fil_rev_8_21_14_0_65_61_21]PIX01660.1 MAG: 6-phosphofructokinase [Hydrogenophilale
MTKYIGILTAGGDSPGLNAAIRGVGKAVVGHYGMHLVGFRDGFRGLMENRTAPLEGGQLSGILTLGGTILGTSRDKPHKMPVGGKIKDMTGVIVENYHAHGLDCLVCLGGGGTQKNALRLKEAGLNIITLPKTIDNDVAMTDITFGFDTALGIATEAVDRLHSTAHSHHRIIVVEIMGHRAGWLALGAGIAGGADVILIPEIPYDVDSVAAAIKRRSRGGKPFSIVAVAEGAISVQEQARQAALENKKVKKAKDADVEEPEIIYADRTIKLAQQLEALTGLEARITILGHLQRGGAPSAADRILSTRLGTAAADLIAEGRYGFMVAARGEATEAVPLEDVAGKVKTVPIDHPWVESARRVETNFGD